MSGRAIRRAVALGFVLAGAIFHYWILRLRGPLTMKQRALWTQQSCRGILRSMGIRYRIEGQPPTHGLVVSNHLSYLDILILAVAMPCFFVAKAEIDGWPFFGHAARIGGAIFLNRSSRKSAASVAKLMSERFKLPIPVVLFPEGTSTDGRHVLPFPSRLIDPAVATKTPITAATLRYAIDGGTPERELCWYGDALFVSHLVKVLGVGGFSAIVRFGPPRIYSDRRAATVQTHDEVVAMRAQMLR